MGMQAAQAELDEINKKYKDSSEERARHTLELYKSKKIRPFAGFVAILVQLPIFIALYFALFRESLPKIAENLLYSFVQVPQHINLNFLGFINLVAAHNILLSLLVGALQYVVAYLSMARIKPGLASLSKERQVAQKMQHNMMLYMFPALIAIIAYTLPAAVGIYFAATNLISIGQEWLIRRDILNNKLS